MEHTEIKEKRQSVAKQRILATAIQLFYAKGIRATGIDTIIAQSGVAKMTFYNHFPSKQRLVVEVLEACAKLWMENLAASISKKKRPEEKLIAIFDFLSEWFNDPNFRGCAFINTCAESNDRAAEECLFSANFKKTLEKQIASLAAEAKLKQPNRLAEKLLVLIDGSIVRALMEGSSEPAGIAKSIAHLLIDSSRIET